MGCKHGQRLWRRRNWAQIDLLNDSEYDLYGQKPTESNNSTPITFCRRRHQPLYPFFYNKEADTPVKKIYINRLVTPQADANQPATV